MTYNVFGGTLNLALTLKATAAMLAFDCNYFILSLLLARGSAKSVKRRFSIF